MASPPDTLAATNGGEAENAPLLAASEAEPAAADPVGGAEATPAALAVAARPRCLTRVCSCCGGDSPLAALLFLLESGSYSDVAVEAAQCDAPTPLRVHRLVLAAHSEVFAKMFFSGFKEAGSRGAVPLDTSPAALHVALSYMYARPYSLSQPDLALDVWEFAHAYDVRGLEAEAVSAVCANPSVDTCFRALDMATLFDSPAAVDAVLSFMATNFQEIATCDAALALSVDALAVLLKKTLHDRLGWLSRSKSCLSPMSPCVREDAQFALWYHCRCDYNTYRRTSEQCEYKCAVDHDQHMCLMFLNNWVCAEEQSRKVYLDELLDIFDFRLVPRIDMKLMSGTAVARLTSSFLTKVVDQIDRGSRYRVPRLQCKACGVVKEKLTVRVGALDTPY